MTKYATRRPARVVLGFASLLLATSGLAVTSGPASAQVPAWAQQCAATTKNPWITSGYCQSHTAWDKYYCKCEFTPPFRGVDLGRRKHADDTFLDEDISDSDIIR